MEGKKQRYFYTQTLFLGLRLFCCEEGFSVPEEIVTFSSQGIEIYKSFPVSYKFEVHRVSSWCLQQKWLLAGDTVGC